MIGRVPKGLKGSDHPFRDSTWPARLPPAFEAVIRDLTYDEVHAMELGAIAIPVTVYWFFGGVVADIILGLVFIIALIFAMFRLPREEGNIPLFIRLISRETWYFLLIFVGLGSLTFGLLTMIM